MARVKGALMTRKRRKKTLSLIFSHIRRDEKLDFYLILLFSSRPQEREGGKAEPLKPIFLLISG